MIFSACGVPRGPLDAGVDVLGVLAEDHDVHPLRVRDRRRRAREVPDRADAGVQVQHLPQRDVEAADAAADRRRQRPLDGDLVRANRLERVVRQPLAVLLLGLLAGRHLEPGDLLLAAERLLHGRVEHADAGAPDVGPRAVSFNKRNNGIVRNDEPSGLARDRGTLGRRFQNCESRHSRFRFRSHHRHTIGRSSQKLWKSLWKSDAGVHIAPRQSAVSSGLHHDGARTDATAVRKPGTTPQRRRKHAIILNADVH